MSDLELEETSTSEPTSTEPLSRYPVAPKTRWVFISALTAIGLLIAFNIGRKVLIDQKQEPKRKSPPPKVRVVDATTVSVVNHRITIAGNGTAGPARTVNLASEVSGRVTQAHPNLRPGGFIKAGELLFEIDSSDIDISVKRLEAEIRAAKAQVSQLRVQQTGAKRTVATSQEAVTLTKRQLARDEKLAKQGHLADAVADQTRLSLTTQRERLRAARTNADSIPHQMSQARAQIAAAEQQLAAQRRLLERKSMVADFDLQVRSGGLEVGGWVAIGQAIATLEDVSQVELAFPVPIEDLTWLTRKATGNLSSRHEWAALLAGREVTIARNDGSPYQWTGKVHRVGAGLSGQTRMIDVYVRVSDVVSAPAGEAPMPLLPGMFCRLSIAGRSLENVVVLPRKTVQPDGDVYLVGKDNKLERREVTVLFNEEDKVIIGGGLKAGERVVTTSLPGAVTGMALKVRGDKPKKSDEKDVAGP